MNYLFFLGSTNELALAELTTVLARFQYPKPFLITERIAQADLGDIPLEKLVELQDILGGTVKIAQVKEETSYLDPEDVLQKVSEILLYHPMKRFVIGEWGRDHLEPIDVYELKNLLKKAGETKHFKDAPRQGASAALLSHRNVAELLIVQTAEGLFFVETLTVQNIDEWSQRDVEKPRRNRKRGMLQPKVARMMLNLALGNADPTKQVLLDPFCGTGTILFEGIELGIPTVLAADSDPEAISEVNENLRWFDSVSDKKFRSQTKVLGVHEHKLNTWIEQPTIIVTEPYLGKLTPQADQVRNVIRGLEKLYRGMLKTYSEILPEGATVAIILPSIQIGTRSLTVENTIKSFKEFGFVQLAGPLRAGRPDSTTQRHVYVVKFDTYGTR